MKLAVKTLKGGKFEVQCEPENTILEIKGKIEEVKSDLPAASMKLIHSGKVLKDDQTVSGCGITEQDFLVVMVTKAKKKAAAAAAAAGATPAKASADADSSKPKAEDKSKAAETAAASTTPATPAAQPSSTTTEQTPAATASATEGASTPAAPSRRSEQDFPDEVVNNLTGMGFPEAEVRHCLRAAGGNPDVAVEFLTNGIPPGMQPGESAGPDTPAAAAAQSGSGGPLQRLRNHPQFNALRQLVQNNPQMLQTVLTQIGQQEPDLLAEINANQATFLEMMNEPIIAADTAAASSSSSSGATGRSAGGVPANLSAGFMESMSNPAQMAQMAQMIQSMSANELNETAQMVGLSPEQLRSTAQALGQIPPEQLQPYMMQAMAQGGGAGLGSLMGGGSGQQVLRLTEEEMAAVDRLAEMGFDRAEAAQAFLACDKNEALAANLLMDGGFGFNDMGDSGNGGAGNGGNNSGGGGGGADDGGDDMYD